MARPLKFDQRVVIRFAADTIARVKAVIDGGDVATYVRDAVEVALKRDETGQSNATKRQGNDPR